MKIAISAAAPVGGYSALATSMIVPGQHYCRENNEVAEFPPFQQVMGWWRQSKGDELVRRLSSITAIAVGLAATLCPQNARAQSGPGYTYGPVTEVDYIHVNYGHFADYMAWVTSTWRPTMEAAKKAGLIIDYKVFTSRPKSPDDPNIYLEFTFKNMAAYAGDIGDQADAFEAITEKVICSSACQDQARVHRNEIRTVLGSEVTREIIFK